MKGLWCDWPKIHLRDLFPGKSWKESNEIMVSAAHMMEGFLRSYGQESIGIIWMNVLDREENPDGMVGNFRVYTKLP